MNSLSSSKLTEKKSKFFAELFSISSENDVGIIISSFKKNHKKANHVCYAFIFEKIEVFKNDGEVGYPANSLLEILKSNSLNSHLLVVARYFGGVKLGPGGVKRAFKSVGRDCVNII